MKTKRQKESGFALLMVFVMAAVIAIGLYYEMPRVAFESQRAREQLLVDRGMQYRRAIQLFYRKFGRYPASMDDLESTNNIRFLRHKYKDPMTGKDDWRIIHIGPGGILTDSLVQKAQDPLKASNSQSGDTSATGTGTNPGDQSGGLNLATVRRPSDQMASGPPGGTGVVTDPNDPNQPLQPLPVQPLPGQPLPGQPVNPAQPYDPNNPNPQPQPALPLQPYDPNNPNPPQPPPGFVQGRGGFVPAPALPGTAPATPGLSGTPGTQATSLIQNLLNTPRTPPSSFTSSASSTSGTTGTTGGGIAGVASKYPGTGIKIIKERKKYKEWEFVYDFKNDSGKQQQIPGQQAGQTGQPGQTGSTSGGAAGTAGTAGTAQPGTPTPPATSQ